MKKREGETLAFSGKKNETKQNIGRIKQEDHFRKISSLGCAGSAFLCLLLFPCSVLRVTGDITHSFSTQTS